MAALLACELPSDDSEEEIYLKSALLIVDMINKLEFPEGEKLLKQAVSAARTIQYLKAKFHAKNLPVIYVNDNFGHWKEDWSAIHRSCLRSKGRPLAEMLKPEKEDFFILKPQHSGFFGTQLDMLLNDLKVGRLVITGIAGNICVLFTVNDAHMRKLKVIVPSDAIASNTKRDNDYALRLFKEVFKLSTCRSRSLRI